MNNVMNSRSPKDFGNTVLRTEVYGVDTSGNEIPNRVLAGLLNSGALKSRNDQRVNSIPLNLAAFDITRFKGRDVTNKTQQEKLQMIREISQKIPYIAHPLDLAKKYHFPEGSVVWRNGLPIKVKNKIEHDVYVRNIFPEEKGRRAGGFEFSHTPDGPVVGRVGTGFDHAELTDMLNNPNKYIGRVAKVYAQEKFPSGALRAPSFNTWHIEKGKEWN